MKRIAVISILLASAFFLGRFTGPDGERDPSGDRSSQKAMQQSMQAAPAYYTCSMHPQVRSIDPEAKCPICAMDLIPLVKGGEASDPGAIKLSNEAMALANVSTTFVSRDKPVR
ncbi:MAG: efflux RND transporter periplasmic adaptor subunit, partial [Planctomycetes bacterium]|nr:efflux RND transporter periplasmic adaptor subunit [Planctomycetota bacterium]